MRISDWSSDVCSSDLVGEGAAHHDLVVAAAAAVGIEVLTVDLMILEVEPGGAVGLDAAGGRDVIGGDRIAQDRERLRLDDVGNGRRRHLHTLEIGRSEEHTSELQSLMSISYAVFCLQKKTDSST